MSCIRMTEPADAPLSAAEVAASAFLLSQSPESTFHNTSGSPSFSVSVFMLP